MRNLLDDVPWHWAYAIAMLGLVGWIVLLTGRLNETYKIATEISAVRSEINSHAKDHIEYSNRITSELDTIKATLYELPDQKAAKPPAVARTPSGIERWSANRDKELRERIRALEEWRYRHER